MSEAVTTLELEAHGTSGGLRVRDCLFVRWARVGAFQRYRDVAKEAGDSSKVFAVFSEDEKYLGLVGERQAALFPKRIFADLLIARQPGPLAANADLNTAMRVLSENRSCEYLPVMEEDERFVGVISQPSICGNLMEIERELRRDRERLVEQLRVELENRRIAASVFTATSEGIMVTDKDTVIRLVNPSFERTTGYALEEVVGKKASVLHSGRHDADFYAEMWKSLRETGQWEGEIWNRRRDGEVYPEWLHINAIKDEAGAAQYYVGIFSDISQQYSLRSQLLHLAYYDPLTDLPNRLLLRDRFNQSIAQAERDKSTVAMLFLDLDNFKNINDSLGHEAGDQLLKSVVERLQRCIRGTDTISRQGGDEFVVLLNDVRDESAIGRLAQQILDAITEPFVIDGSAITTSVSIGISLYPSDSKDFETLIKQADTALYHAKSSGRNAYSFFAEKMNHDALARMRLQNDLGTALRNNEFLLHYQPQVDLVQGIVVGVEALVRWQMPGKPIMAPGGFIEAAEQCGLIIPIGEWVLNEACRQAAAWLQAGLPELKMAVNLSALQFRRSNIVETVSTALERSGLPARCLELELTESVFLHDTDSAADILRQLKKLGVQLTIDDFGTGYSSLSYLKRLPVDRLKIDQSFVRDLTVDPDDAAIVRAVIHLGHSLQLAVVAEGVETEGQLAFIRKWGCNEMQGYYCSRPMPAADIEPLLQHGCILPQAEAGEGESRVLLLVDDEENILNAVARVLRPDGYRILRATSGEAALELLATNEVGVIVSDQRMPGMSGVDFLRRAKELHPDTIRIVLSGYTELKSVTDAINEGAAFKFLTKPWDDVLLRANIRDAFRHRELVRENERLSAQLAKAGITSP